MTLKEKMALWVGCSAAGLIFLLGVETGGSSVPGVLGGGVSAYVLCLLMPGEAPREWARYIGLRLLFAAGILAMLAYLQPEMPWPIRIILFIAVFIVALGGALVSDAIRERFFPPRR